ncbi:hypothetical protein GCM10022384_21150 [Streptomyces marokkonensis]|uniref:Esterase n=1 Tax=Streptomyces marokkonensis TaxID=324855 RepID=A0ABP7PQZ3_9ACTN
MGLTSDEVLALAVLSGVLLFAGTVWLWPRLARRTWRVVIGGVVLLFATQLAVFAAVGLVANQSFGFYGSWADLFGRENGQGVVVDHSADEPADGECVDVPRGPQTETFFAKDLPQAVSAHYRVERGTGNWGIVGNSTGGYCALKLALHHPDVYAAGAGLSAYYDAPSDPTTGDLFQGDEGRKNRADLWWYLKNLPAPETSLLVTSSKSGETNYKDTWKFIERVKDRKPTRVSSIILESGGHNFNTWRREIPATLRWLGERLEGRGRGPADGPSDGPADGPAGGQVAGSTGGSVGEDGSVEMILK